MPTPPCVLVTRPRDDAQRWVRQLQEAGLQAQALPLIEIAPVLDAPALDETWRHLHRYAALMFVSGNAVAHFFGGRQRPWPASVRCLAPGPGTARALQGQGVPAALIDCPPEDAAQFDSEALWSVIGDRPWQGRRVLMVRGRSSQPAEAPGRDWMIRQLQAAGAEVDAIVVYERRAPQFTPAEQQRMGAAASDGSLWLFSSSEALGHLPGGVDWRSARALATHPRIAEAARRAGFGWVRETRPAVADVVASIKSSNT